MKPIGPSKKKGRSQSAARVDFKSNTEDPEPPSKALITHWIQTTVGQARTLNPQHFANTNLTTFDSVSASVYLTDETEARDYNLKFRQKDYATNVLAFPAEWPDLPMAQITATAELGDILACAPVIRREAKEQSKPLLHHWTHMMVHSTLHLLGYDHQCETDAQVMESLEVQILKALDIPNPYAPEPIKTTTDAQTRAPDLLIETVN